MQEQILGDYRIIRPIGTGTLGSVFLAEHRFIKKHFVLKVLPQELCQDKDFIKRFEEEAANLALLDHPHIVKIHNLSFANGVYFLVTDCILDSIGETTNLAHYMSGRKERLREEELLSVMKQLANALDYAHLKIGLVHRSLKLNNILIGRGNLGIDIFISDFGLAKIISPGKIVMRTFKELSEALGALSAEPKSDERYSPIAVDNDKLNKLSHSFLQSYAFLAPEQKRFEQVGASADIYAYGILAYYLIAGQFPEGKFLMPSEIATEYHYDWDYLISQCLNQDPRGRPTQLLPLLEDKKNRCLHKSSNLPAEETKQTSSATIEELKLGSLRPNFSFHMEREEPELKPIIHRTIDKQPDALQQSITVPVAVGAAIENKENTAEISESFSKNWQSTVSNVGRQMIEPTRIEQALVSENSSTTLNINPMLNRDPIVTQYHPEKKETHDTEPIQTEMIIVRGGHFLRGSNSGNRDEMPRHKISLESFAMDIHPVSNEQFLRFLDYMGGEKDQNYNDLIRLKDSRISRSSGKLAIESGYSKHPVVGVTWYGAICYAKWAGKRLPTEAEWEVAAYGGHENYVYPTGEQIEKSQANFFSSDTTPVMSYNPNGYGLYDMAGNVYEWCNDWYGYNYYEMSAQEPKNPKGPLQGVYRVLRGGCWKSLQEDMRCSHRHRNNPGTVNSTYGFRCAADVGV